MEAKQTVQEIQEPRLNARRASRMASPCASGRLDRNGDSQEGVAVSAAGFIVCGSKIRIIPGRPLRMPAVDVREAIAAEEGRAT